MEIWKPVSGWEGYYEVSDLGNVRSLTRTAECFVRGKLQVRVHKGKPLRAPIGKNGYVMYSFTAPGGIREYHTGHQLVARHFLPSPAPGEEVCHRDGDRTNNRVTNLRYGTRSSNALDRHEHGTMNQANGTSHYFHKLDDDKVRWIRKNQGVMSQRAMAELLGVTHGVIGLVQRREGWKHVK
jgi:hypothetical protein